MNGEEEYILNLCTKPTYRFKNIATRANYNPIYFIKNKDGILHNILLLYLLIFILLEYFDKQLKIIGKFRICSIFFPTTIQRIRNSFILLKIETSK